MVIFERLNIMSREISCCFSGHRRLEWDFSIEELKRTIVSLIEKGYKIFIAGGALGFDTEVAVAVLQLKKKYKDIKLHIYVPCIGQESRWQKKDIKLYNAILKRADYVDMPSNYYNNECMKKRNYKMVDNASFLVTYFNGNQISGTAQTIRYAKKCGLEIINLYAERDDDF